MGSGQLCMYVCAVIVSSELSRKILGQSTQTIMVSCGYSEFVGEICGPSSDNPANVQCVTIAKCDKDTKAHLRSYKVSDSSLDTEARLLLARAGKL